MRPSVKPSNNNQNNPFGGLNLRLNPENAPPTEDEPLRTLIVGNLGDRIGEELLFELFLQAGPLSGIRMPRDKVNRPTGMAFVVFRHPASVDFAIRLMSGIRLYGRELVLTKMNDSGTTRPAQPPPFLPPQSTHFLSGDGDKGYHNSHEHFMYQPAPRPLLMAPPPPPPFFAMAKAPFANHTPVPYFRPPMYPQAPHSDPGYNSHNNQSNNQDSHGGGDFRQSHVDHAGYIDRSRNDFSSRQHQSHHQNSKGETPKRPVPYARPSAYSRGNDWR